MKYTIMFYGGMVMTVVMFIYSVILYRRLEMTTVIRDLTGYDIKKIWKKERQQTIPQVEEESVRPKQAVIQLGTGTIVMTEPLTKTIVIEDETMAITEELEDNQFTIVVDEMVIHSTSK